MTSQEFIESLDNEQLLALLQALEYERLETSEMYADVEDEAYIRGLLVYSQGSLTT